VTTGGNTIDVSDKSEAEKGEVYANQISFFWQHLFQLTNILSEVFIRCQVSHCTDMDILYENTIEIMDELSRLY
jgi:hypothetical protein